MKYAVIILNYNTFEDTQNAIKSVEQNATDEYRIIIVDNCSDDAEKLHLLKDDRTDVIYMKKNLGYARGNNEGAWFAIGENEPDYLVFMNSDVIIREKSTIEDIIEACEQEGTIGGQPIVNTYSNNLEPNRQINIRRVRTYSDVLINSNLFMRCIFSKKHQKTFYRELMPYNTRVRYEVPSGAFFVIRADIFSEIEGFDDRTFLYNEEEMLGYKVKKINQAFIFEPKHIVDHMQGMSTGARGNKVNEFALNCRIESTSIYLREYLKCNFMQIAVVKGLIRIDPFLVQMECNIKKIIKRIIGRKNYKEIR